MKIIIEEPASGEEDQIIIRCHNMSEEILKLISDMKSYDKELIGYDKEQIHRLDLKDIYYFEAVDSKVFICGQKRVFESKLKLYEIEQKFSQGHFFRASKSVVLNLKKVKYLSTAFSGRFEATLDNGEKVIISRQYVPELKCKLGL